MKILCLGNNSEDTDKKTTVLALQNHAMNHGFVGQGTFIPDRDGYYHTSLADIDSGDIAVLAKHFDKLIMLDQPVNEWSHPVLFSSTYKLCNDLHSQGHVVEYQNPNTVANIEYWSNLLSNNKSFCMYPFMHLIEQDGYATVCSRSRQPIVKVSDITNWSTDPAYTNLREKMLRGEKIPEHCNNCYGVEKDGGKGARYFDSIKWITELGITTLDDLKKIQNPVYVEVRPSNQCNIMCRTCGPKYSHLLDREFKKIGIEIKSLNVWEKYSSFDMVDLDSIKLLYITGGEPTAIPEVTEFLQRCVAQGRTDFEIMINTNAVKITDKLMNLFDKFSKLGFSCSLDSVGKVNDYIRYPAKFDTVVANIKNLRAHGHHVAFITVASLYSIEHLGELFEFFDQEFASAPVQLQHAYHVDHYMSPYFHPNWQQCVKSLQRCKNTKVYYNYSRGTKSIVDTLLAHYLQAPSTNTQKLTEFFEFNDKLDQSRNMFLKDYCPNLEQARAQIKVDK